MNDKNITQIQNMLTTCLDCAGVEPEQTLVPVIKQGALNNYYVDLCIEDYDEEQLAYLTGFLAERIGMKNVWLDTYPKSRRANFELAIPYEKLAR